MKPTPRVAPARRSPAQLAQLEKARLAKMVRDAERHVAAAAVGESCRVLCVGIDTLNLSSRAELRTDVVEQLEALKEEALKAAREGLALPRWRAHALGRGVELEVMPYGSKKGSLVLSSEAVVVVLSPKGPRNMPRAYVELKSAFLWSGWEHASELACELLRDISATGQRVDVQVSRLDLAVDFCGWQPTPDMLNDVIGRVVRRETNYEWLPKKTKAPDGAWVEVHGSGRRFTGFTFGRGELLARLYDKTVEVRVHAKQWFEEKWRAAGWRGVELDGHVWRLEFQIRREPLRNAQLVAEEGDLEVKAWADMKRGLNALWQYLTKKWLSYRLPRTARQRVRLHPCWRVLMAVRFADCPDGTLYRHQLSWNRERCDGAKCGYDLRSAVLHRLERGGARPTRAEFEEDLAFANKAARAHFEHKHGEELYDRAMALFDRHTAFARMFTRQRAPATA